MDSYKTKIIKSSQTVNSGKSVPLNAAVSKAGKPTLPPAGRTPGAGKPPQEKSSSSDAASYSEQQVKEAYNKGYADGTAKQKKEALHTLEALAAMTKALPSIQKDILHKGEEQIVKLAVAVAEKILQSEVASRKDAVIGVLRTALRNVSDTEGMKIRLNPQDFRYMMEVKKDFLQSFDGIRNITFEEDGAIKRGGAVIETAFGEVDARLENQLKEIRSAMLKP